jgi:hypothetical protein
MEIWMKRFLAMFNNFISQLFSIFNYFARTEKRHCMLQQAEDIWNALKV